ncbi:uncharacterized protein LOC112137320 isoform X1 [Oryzias melastigma]|uniref:uncharacterized protein LOC112137320 isoform X1 n=1 Tax=Oryzias melastigma TaxID=30732 RepID=UPI000CF810FC|nr:uncharacterized protein LOC112137320 isoform X1 [Oryzias melastigma]
MDSFVANKLIEWQLPELTDIFKDQEIDEEAFKLLDAETIRNLIPKVGPRLKFSKLHKELMSLNAERPITPSTSHNVATILPAEESEEASEVLLLSPSSVFDIRQVLNDTLSGKDILRSLDDVGAISRRQRIVLVQILVSFLIDKFGERPTTATKEALALSLVQTFPSLHDGSASGHEIWLSKSRKAVKNGKIYYYPATGFIEERLRNVRKKIRSHGFNQQSHEVNEPQRVQIPESMVPEERSQQQKEWLKHNCYLLTQVQEYMEETALYRANWI